MTDRDERRLRTIVDALRRRLNPSRIVFFGSRARGDSQPGADFDVAIDTPSPDFRTRRKIREEVDLLAGLHHVDLVYLPSLRPDFRRIVLETGKVVYEKAA